MKEVKVTRLRRNRHVDDQIAEGRDEVIRLQGRIRTIISQIREIEASTPRPERGTD